MFNRKTETITSVVLLRAIAASWVCLIHLGMITNFHGNRIINWIISEGQNGVAIFFVISGFILPYSLYKNEYRITRFFKFLLKRSIRIDPPYWVSIVLIFLLTPLSLSALNIFTVFLHLTYIVPFVNGVHWYSDVFWTLSIEFQFYILLGLFYPILMRINPKLAIGVLILITIFFVSIFKFNYRGIIFTNIYDFVFGFILFLGYIKKISIKTLLFVLLLFSAYVMFGVSIKTGFTPLIASVIIFYYRKNNRVPFLSFLGNISYSLYLTHLSIGIFYVSEIQPFIKNETVLFVSSLCVSIFFAYLFYILIEKPSIKLSKTIILKTYCEKVPVTIQ